MTKEKKLYEKMLACKKGSKSRRTFKMTLHRIFSKDKYGFYKIICTDCGRLRFTTHPNELKDSMTLAEKAKVIKWANKDD